MKRDWNIVRDILLEVEGLEYGQTLKFSRIPVEDIANLPWLRPSDFNQNEWEKISNLQRFHNADLLLDGEFVKENDPPLSNSIEIELVSLTWKGSDLLESIRDQMVWNGVMKKIKELGTPVTLSVLKNIAENIIKSLYGLS